MNERVTFGDLLAMHELGALDADAVLMVETPAKTLVPRKWDVRIDRHGDLVVSVREHQGELLAEEDVR